MTTCDAELFGHLVEAITPEMINKIGGLLISDSSSKLREIASDWASWVHIILHYHLHMKRFAAVSMESACPSSTFRHYVLNMDTLLDPYDQRIVKIIVAVFGIVTKESSGIIITDAHYTSLSKLLGHKKLFEDENAPANSSAFPIYTRLMPKRPCTNIK